jgi:hypothetical protein
MRPHSGLQKQILSLYRQLCRAVHAKPAEFPQHKRAELLAHIRAQFDQHKSVRRSQIDFIEVLLRRGQKKLLLVKQPGFAGVVPPPSKS